MRLHAFCLLAALSVSACAPAEVRWQASFDASPNFTTVNADAMTLTVTCHAGAVFTVGIARTSISDRGKIAPAAFVIDGVRFETSFEGPEYSNAPILVADFEDAERLNALGRALLAARQIEWAGGPQFRTAPTRWGPFAPDPEHTQRTARACG